MFFIFFNVPNDQSYTQLTFVGASFTLSGKVKAGAIPIAIGTPNCILTSQCK